MHKKEETTGKSILTAQNFLDTCRICFANHGHLYDTKTSMFEDQTVDELFLSLVNAKELNIADNYAHVVYPQFICHGCVKNLVYTRIFLDQCRKAHKTLSKVYVYLTLHQHQSVIISKPIHIYKNVNALVTHRCKLNRGAPKMTLELEKVTSRKNQAVEVLNEDVDIKFEGNKPNASNLKVCKGSKKRTASNTKINVTSKKLKIITTPKLDETDKCLTNTDQSSTQNQGVQKNEPLETVKFIKKKRKSRGRKKDTPTLKTIPKIIETQVTDMPPDGNFNNVQLQIQNSWQEDSWNDDVFGENVERIKNGLDPSPADFFTNINFYNRDTAYQELYTLHLENVKNRQEKDFLARQNKYMHVRQDDSLSSKTDNIHQRQQDPAYDVNNSTDNCQGQLFPEVNDNLDNGGSYINDNTCQNDIIDDIDVKQQPSAENVKEEITDLEEISIQGKLDTVKLTRALADINRDRRNIDSDHCYTNKNVYKNVRYIMPRLNFQRLNDLLYPAPDVAKKRDEVLAGNITKRMASILSGNSADKSEEYAEEGHKDIREHPNLGDHFSENLERDDYKTVKMETNFGEKSSEKHENYTAADLKDVKVEPQSDDFDKKETYDYVRPEYVEMDVDYPNLMHKIKQEPREELQNY